MRSVYLACLLTASLATSKALPSLKPHEARGAPAGYGTLTTVTNGSIIRATINNPPVNLWDYKLAADFSTFIGTLAKTANTSDVKVVILSSAIPDFFIDHIDIHAVSAASPELPPANSTLTGVQLLETEQYLQTLPIIFIAEIDGRTTGAGNEVAVQCDIRYAGPGAKLSQLEVGFGELPGTGGLQFLVSLIGRARALEYILSARSVDAIEAAAIGWVNRAFSSEMVLKTEVTALAERIATFPKQGLAAIKSRVNVQKPTEGDIKGDNSLFTELEKTTVVQQSQDRYLVLSANESANVFEKGIPEDIPEVLI
ncbi:hypothetical protein MMC12_004224 [Toensbergia leucococca]|nr:hypothetical protein [Toensbergia leucococca]